MNPDAGRSHPGFLGAVRRRLFIATEFAWRCAAVGRGRGGTTSPGPSREHDGDVVARPIRGVGILRLSIGTLEHGTFVRTGDMAVVPVSCRAATVCMLVALSLSSGFAAATSVPCWISARCCRASARAALRDKSGWRPSTFSRCFPQKRKRGIHFSLPPLLGLSGTQILINQLLDVGPRMIREPERAAARCWPARFLAPTQRGSRFACDRETGFRCSRGRPTSFHHRSSSGAPCRSCRFSDRGCGRR